MKLKTQLTQSDPRDCPRSHLALLILCALMLMPPLAHAAIEKALPEPTVVSRSPHSRTWQTVREVQIGNQTILQTNSYQEIANGMHFVRDGQLVESSETIAVINGYGVADQGQHQAIFSPSITDSPAVDYTHEASRFQSRILGLSYLDTRSGRSAMFSITKDSIGTVRENQVTYADAFTDGVKCDVHFTYKRDSFSQEILILAQLPPPGAFQLDEQSTRLQVWTELFDPPVPTVKETRFVYEEKDPAVRQAFAEPDFKDDFLSFGPLQIAHGKAFMIDTEAIRQAGINVEEEVPVSKEWVSTPEGRHFLVESVQFEFIKPLLDTLPVAALSKESDQNSRLAVLKESKGLARSEFLASLPKAGKTKRSDAKILMAQAGSSPRKYRAANLDYTTLITQTSLTLKGNETYFVNSAVSLSGTNICEGGAVIKFSTNASQISITGSGAVLTFLTSSYRQAVFTAQDDDSVGEKIGGSTGNPANKWYAKYALYYDGSAANNVSVSNLRISYATNAVFFHANPGAVLSHCQFIHCQTAIGTYSGGFSARNCLIYDAATAFSLSLECDGSGENVTVDKATNLSSLAALCTLSLINSLLVNVTTNGTYSGSNNASNTTGANVFQTVGAGAHYLLPGSPYRDSGTTNINASLLADLRDRTTWAPTLYDHTNTVTIPTTFSPIAQRDTDVPDLGFHYSPIDYALGYFAVTNTTLTVSPGTAIAVFGYDGLLLYDNAQLTCVGTPGLRIHLCRYYCVQEISTNWSNTATNGIVNFATYNFGNGPPSVQFRFTDFDELSGNNWHAYFQGGTWAPLAVTIQDCTFSSAKTEFGGDPTTTLNLQNNLFERVTCTFENYPMVFCYNTLFKNGVVSIYSNNTNNWVFKDDAFDGTTLNYGLTPLTHSNNAYINGSARLTPTNANDVVLSSLAYQSGFLGRYYQPTNSALINAGSRNATNAGLFASTVLSSQVPETNTVVDISYHYIGINLATGLPFDADADGIWDYLEDANQNGVYDPALGETDWQTYNSKYGIGPGPGLVVFTPLK